MEPISASSAVQQMIGRYKEHGFVGFRLVKTYQAVTSWPWSLSLIHWSPTLTCQHWQYTGGWSWLCTHNTITMNTLGLRHEPAWLLHQHEPAILLITSLKGRWPMWFFIYLTQYPEPPKDDIGSCKSCGLCNYELILFNISHLPGGWLVPKKNIRMMGMILPVAEVGLEKWPAWWYISPASWDTRHRETALFPFPSCASFNASFRASMALELPL